MSLFSLYKCVLFLLLRKTHHHTLFYLQCLGFILAMSCLWSESQVTVKAAIESCPIKLSSILLFFHLPWPQILVKIRAVSCTMAPVAARYSTQLHCALKWMALLSHLCIWCKSMARICPNRAHKHHFSYVIISLFSVFPPLTWLKPLAIRHNYLDCVNRVSEAGKSQVSDSEWGGNGPHLLQCVSWTGRRPAHPEKLCASPQGPLYQAEQSGAFRGNKAQCFSLCIWVYVSVEFSTPLSSWPGVYPKAILQQVSTVVSSSTLFTLCGCQLGHKKEKSLGHFQNDFHCRISAFGRMQLGTCQERKEIKDPRVRAWSGPIEVWLEEDCGCLLPKPSRANWRIWSSGENSMRWRWRIS